VILIRFFWWWWGKEGKSLDEKAGLVKLVFVVGTKTFLSRPKEE
jgi:hypothetical protein